ncbi:hypothetical protein PCE1_001748 [Barthelona sp. PCE]
MEPTDSSTDPRTVLRYQISQTLNNIANFDNVGLHVSTELFGQLFERYLDDLVTFAAHGKRKTINMQDLLVLLRHNDYLREHFASKIVVKPKKSRAKKSVSNKKNDK